VECTCIHTYIYRHICTCLYLLTTFFISCLSISMLLFIIVYPLFYFTCVYIWTFLCWIQNSYSHYNNINRNILIVVAKSYSTKVRLQGDPVYLHCNSTCSATSSVQWYRGNRRLTIDYKKYFLTENQGLIIMNVTSVDGATYRCQSGTILRTEHILHITRKSFVFHGSIMLHYYTQ